MKLYTRKGDDGMTSIWGGRGLSKDHPRMKAIGAVDECNAAIGASRAQGVPDVLDGILHGAQTRLFVVGSELMAPDHSAGGSSLPRLNDRDVAETEAAIDLLESQLPQLHNFVLPGGTGAGAALHVARAACRHAERRVATLGRYEAVIPAVPSYLNRLADLLFISARYANSLAGVDDVVWSRSSA